MTDATKAMKDLFGCVQCGSFATTKATLVGGFNTQLCTECQNTWHIFVIKQEAFATYRRTRQDTDILLARTCGDGVDRTDEIRALNERAAQLELQLFDLADRWVTGDVD